VKYSDLSKRAQFLVDTVDLERATGVEGARWEHFQLMHLSDNSTLRIEAKSRQVAWSWTVSAEAIAEAVLDGTSTAFVSINLDEAKEKIRYSKAVLETINISGLPKLIRDNELGLEFDNGARLLSLPARPPRGKARFNIALDEFAHVQHDRQIYVAAMPILSKGGRLRVGSSTMGARGQFWEIDTQKLKPYPGYNRKRTPWWETYAFSKNPALARIAAPAMRTADRVERFGNDRITLIFQNMVLEDFQQEYEAEYVDETTALITWDDIQKNQTAFESAGLKYWKANGKDEALSIIQDVQTAIKAGECEPVLSMGIDIGRVHDKTEGIITGNTTTGALPVRVLITLDRCEFDTQQHVFNEVIRRLPIKQALVDKNGIGAQLAENLQRTGRAVGVDFTMQTKSLWAVEARLQFERANVPIPPERDLAYQTHSIKKTITPSGNTVFDAERTVDGHADKFWALALAIYAGKASPWLA